MIKAVIFDMNGVIIDDEHLHELAFIETVKPFGIALTHAAYQECCVGKTDLRGFESIALKYSVPLPVEKLLVLKSQTYLKLFPTHKKAYPGVIQLIQKLSQSYQLGLASSSSRSEVDLILKEFGLTSLFSVTISGNDVLHGKPDPEPYLKTATLLGVSISNCLVIEDTPTGIASAKAAGAYCLGITTTHTQELLSDADLIIHSFEEIDPTTIGLFR